MIAMARLSEAQAAFVRQLGPDGFITRTIGEGFTDWVGRPISIATVKGLVKRRVGGGRGRHPARRRRAGPGSIHHEMKNPAAGAAGPSGRMIKSFTAITFATAPVNKAVTL